MEMIYSTRNCLFWLKLFKQQNKVYSHAGKEFCADYTRNLFKKHWKMNCIFFQLLIVTSLVSLKRVKIGKLNLYSSIQSTLNEFNIFSQIAARCSVELHSWAV